MKRKVILILFLLSILAVSCKNNKKTELTVEAYEPHPTWTADSTNNFWE